jgi:DNA-binding CsgD family transcriptional regulator
MFERLNAHSASTSSAPVQAPVPTRAWPTTYAGPERRAAQGSINSCLTRMLDEIDYGMLLVASDAQVVFFNHAARLELDGDHPLQLMGRALRAQRAQDVAPLFDALQSAQRGLRKLVTLGAGEHRVSVSVVPLPEACHDGYGLRRNDDRSGDTGTLTLVVLAKRHVCERLSVQGFARSMNLTPAETRVLEQLCAGTRAAAIARAQGVAVSTIRTQIGSIRQKTQSPSINDVIRQVALLPPILGALRGGGFMPGR